MRIGLINHRFSITTPNNTLNNGRQRDGTAVPPHDEIPEKCTGFGVYGHFQN